MTEHVPLTQPRPDLGPEFFLRASADRSSDMTGRKDQIGRVLTADQIDQGQAGLGVDHVIVLADHIQHRTGDRLEIDGLTSNLELILDQGVL